MRFTVRWRIIMRRYTQTIVTLRLIGIDDPARQYRQTLLDVIVVNAVEVKPLATGVRARKLFGK